VLYNSSICIYRLKTSVVRLRHCPHSSNTWCCKINDIKPGIEGEYVNETSTHTDLLHFAEKFFYREYDEVLSGIFPAQCPPLPCLLDACTAAVKAVRTRPLSPSQACPAAGSHLPIWLALPVRPPKHPMYRPSDGCG